MPSISLPWQSQSYTAGRILFHSLDVHPFRATLTALSTPKAKDSFWSVIPFIWSIWPIFPAISYSTCKGCRFFISATSANQLGEVIFAKVVSFTSLGLPSIALAFLLTRWF
jgi:hypothetical protein